MASPTFYSEVTATANRPNSASSSTAKKKVTFTGEGASSTSSLLRFVVLSRFAKCFALSHPAVEEVDLEALGQMSHAEGMSEELFINLKQTRVKL